MRYKRCISVISAVFGVFTSGGADLSAQRRSADVVFEARFVQADPVTRQALADRKQRMPTPQGGRSPSRTAADRLKARQEFQNSRRPDVHVMEKGFSPLRLFAQRQGKGAKIFALPSLETSFGREVTFLVGRRTPPPTIPDQALLGSLPAGVDLGQPALPEQDFGIKLGFRALEMSNGDVHVFVRTRSLGVDFTDSQMQQGHFVPSMTVGGGDYQFDLTKGQSFALTGLVTDELLASLDRVDGVLQDRLFSEVRRMHRLKDGRALVLVVTPRFPGSRQPASKP